MVKEDERKACEQQIRLLIDTTYLFIFWELLSIGYGKIISKLMILVHFGCADFLQEARNAERTAENFKNNNLVKIPRVYWVWKSRLLFVMYYFLLTTSRT